MGPQGLEGQLSDLKRTLSDLEKALSDLERALSCIWMVLSDLERALSDLEGPLSLERDLEDPLKPKERHVGPWEGPLGPRNGSPRKEGPLGPRSYQGCHLPASVSYLISIIITSTRRDSGVKLVEKLAKNCVLHTAAALSLHGFRHWSGFLKFLLNKLNRSALSIPCPTCAGSEVDRKVGLQMSNPTFLSISDPAQDADPAGTAAGAGRVPGSGSILSETAHSGPLLYFACLDKRHMHTHCYEDPT